MSENTILEIVDENITQFSSDENEKRTFWVYPEEYKVINSIQIQKNLNSKETVIYSTIVWRVKIYFATHK